MAMQAPGKVSDLNDAERGLWTQLVSRDLAGQARFAAQLPTPPQPKSWFFNSAQYGLANAVTRDISWTAFPKPFPLNYVGVDESRDMQVEYCEWEVARDPATRKIVRVTFTSETEDYYDFLWTLDRTRVLDLYHKHVSPAVKLEQLTENGKYDPKNVWNFSSGSAAAGMGRGRLMHMAQINNSLGAAMNLAARATWPIVDATGVPVTAEQSLIACNEFGDSRRHSDPHIGAQVNELVRAGHEVSFADPVGLYIDSIDLTDFQAPDGVPAKDLVRRTRGEEGFALRYVFEAPPGAGFVLGDVLIGDSRIRFGGEIAEKLRIRIRGAARPAAQPAPKLLCRTFEVQGEAAIATGAIEAVKPAETSSRMYIESVDLAPE